MINGASETINELWNHSQKHIFSIKADKAQQSAKSGLFGMGKISLEIVRNTTVVLKIEDARSEAMEFFIQSKPTSQIKPRLNKEGIDIAFIPCNHFLLPLDICEYFIYIEGLPKTPLIDGIPHIMPRNIAETAIFDGILKLTCWNEGKIVKNLGTMFFRTDRFSESFFELIEQQASVAALLGMNKFIEEVPLSNEHLLDVSSRLEAAYLEGSSEYKKNIESTRKILQKKMTASGSVISIRISIFDILPGEYISMGQDVSDKMTRARFFTDWYPKFFHLKSEADAIADVMIKWLGLPNDPGIFNWSKRNELNAILEENMGVENFQSNIARFANFIFR